MCCSSVLLCDTGFGASSLETEAIKIQILCVGGHFRCGGWQGRGQKDGNRSPEHSCSPAVPRPGAALASPTAALQPGQDKDEASAPCKRNFLQTGAKVRDHIPSLCPC